MPSTWFRASWLYSYEPKNYSDMTKKILHRSEITPKNLKAIFNMVAALYNRLVKNHRGRIKVSITEDSKGLEIKLRIPTLDLSSSMKVLIHLCIDKFIAKDSYLKLRDEEDT